MRALVVAFAVFGLAFGAAAETRLALVIDQTNYTHTSELSRVALADSEGDQIEAALKDTGFTVMRVSDRTRAGLNTALDDFRIRLENASDAIGFVYYTGHGAQHPQSGSSYLLGTDARLRAASDLATYGIDLEAQRNGFAATGAKAVFLVFDACRNVVSGSGYKANVKGISRVDAQADMLIAYSTGLNDVAEEGVYAPILAEEMRRAGQPAETVFANVQRRVATNTGRKQKPWYDPQLYNTVCFAGCTASDTSSASILKEAPALPARSPATDPSLDCDTCPNFMETIFEGGRSAWVSEPVDFGRWQAFCRGRSCDDAVFRQEPHKPAVSVSWMAASEYAAWLSSRTGRPMRLPTAKELEAILQSGDGRPKTAISEWSSTCFGGEYDKACAQYEVRGLDQSGSLVSNRFSLASKGKSLGFRVISDGP